MSEIRVAYEPDFAPLTAVEDEAATGLVIKLLDRVFAEIDAERAALSVAQSAGQVPNMVTDADMDVLKQHFDEDQIVEIVAVRNV